MAKVTKKIKDRSEILANLLRENNPRLANDPEKLGAAIANFEKLIAKNGNETPDAMIANSILIQGRNAMATLLGMDLLPEPTTKEIEALQKAGK